jgi:hypothetical protein
MDDLTAGQALPHVNAANIDLPPRGSRRYKLSEEDFHAWERGFAAFGVLVLVTRLQIYCDAPLLGHAKPRYKYYASRNRGTMFPNI